MNSYNAAHAEKLAKINALHFNEVAKMEKERVPSKSEESVRITRKPVLPYFLVN
jgi:hypothetical protein